MAGPTIERARLDDRAMIDEIAALDEEERTVHGRPALGEAVWRDLDRPGPDSAGFLSRTGGRPCGYLHVARSDTFAARHWAASLAVAPSAVLSEVVAPLVDVGVAHVADHGGGRFVLWLFGPSEDDDAALAAVGLPKERDVLELRVALPLRETPVWPAGVTVRDFEPGRDEQAWLEVNNRAFGNHPEQGGWVESTLRRRLAEPWFDPSLFVLAFDAVGLAGFDWLKIHAGHGRDREVGEIFVIGVDPRAQGTGLGRALAIAGLDRVALRRVGTGSLFVAADNAAGRRLYASLGFTLHRVDRAYAREVAAR